MCDAIERVAIVCDVVFEHGNKEIRLYVSPSKQHKTACFIVTGSGEIEVGTRGNGRRCVLEDVSINELKTHADLLKQWLATDSIEDYDGWQIREPARDD